MFHNTVHPSSVRVYKFINDVLNSFFNFILEYGLLIIFLFILGALTPEFGTRELLLDIDLNNKIDKLSSGSNLKQIFWLCIFLSLSFLFLKGYIGKRPKTYFRVITYFLLPLVFLIVSSFGSDYQSISFKRVLFQVLFIHSIVLATISVYSRSAFHKNIKYTLYFFVFMTFIALLNGTAFNLNGAMAGFNFSKNRFCINLIALLSLYLISCELNNEKINRFIVSIALLFLLLSKGKTMILGLVVLLPLLLFKRRTSYLKLVNYTLLVLAILLFVIYPAWTLSFYDFDHIGRYMEPDSLTGRGIIWSLVYESLNSFERFFTGFGYGTFFNTPAVPYFFDVEHSFLPYVTTTHNGFIDLLSQIGFFGVLACSTLIFVVIYRSKQFYGQFTCYFFIFHNLTESSFFKDQHSMMFSITVVLVLSCITSNSQTRKSNSTSNVCH